MRIGDGGALQFSRKIVEGVDVDLRESAGVCVNLTGSERV